MDAGVGWEGRVLSKSRGASRGEDEASQQAESPDRSLRTGTFAEHQQSQDRGYERLGQVQRGNCGSRQPSQAAGEQ